MSVSLAELPNPAKLYKTAQAEIKRRNIKPRLTVPDFWTSQSHSTIRTQHGTVPFVPFPWQIEFVNNITDREQILKSRDVGSSEICVRYFCWRQLRDGGNILIKADKHDNAKNLIAIAKQYLTSLPEGELPTLLKDNETELELAGIGTIKAMAQGGGRSERCRYLLMTERAFWERPDEELAAVSGALVAGGMEIIESTANGFNEYHALWADDHNGYRKTFVGWPDNPTHTPLWRAAKEQLHAGSPHKLAQEYPASPREAFVASGNCRFEVEMIQAFLDDCRPPITSTENGQLQIWRKPVVGRHYVIGADVAEGRDAGNDKLDYSAAVVLDWQTGLQVASLHGQWALDVYASMLDALGRQYNKALLGVERNNHGHAVLLALRQLQYPQLYEHQPPANDLAHKHIKVNKAVGWLTNAQTKPVMESEFAAAITSQSICSYDKGLWDECLSYVRKGDGTSGGQSGCHDDRCIAAMIAWQMRKHVRAPGSGGIVVGKVSVK